MMSASCAVTSIGLLTWLHHVLAFVLVGTIVAVGLAVQIEADDFRAVGYDVDAISFHRRRGTETDRRLIQVVAFPQQPRHDQLPLKTPSASLRHNSTPGVRAPGVSTPGVALVPRILRCPVVGANQHAPLCDNRRCVSLASQIYRPLDVLARGRVETVWQALLVRYHVARVALAPLRLVLTPGRKDRGQAGYRDQQPGQTTARKLHHVGRLCSEGVRNAHTL